MISDDRSAVNDPATNDSDDTVVMGTSECNDSILLATTCVPRVQNLTPKELVFTADLIHAICPERQSATAINELLVFLQHVIGKLEFGKWDLYPQ